MAIIQDYSGGSTLDLATKLLIRFRYMVGIGGFKEFIIKKVYD